MRGVNAQTPIKYQEVNRSMKQYFKMMSRTLLAAALVLLMTGCQSGDQASKEKETEVKSEDIQEAELEEAKKETDVDWAKDVRAIPQTLKEVVEYPVGRFASEDGNVPEAELQEITSDIPDFVEDASGDELEKLFEYLYSLFKMEYKDPLTLLRSTEITEGPDDGSGAEEKASYNVVILLDASGSMANKIGSQTRMHLAKEAIRHFASSLPAEANVGLRVYGHKGTGSQADKAMSCESNELIYPIQPYDKESLSGSLDQFDPAGWTPLADAIEKAQHDLEKFAGADDENVIFVVSDGVETCGGDPVQAASALKESGISPIVHIIGFDVASKEEQQLQDVAKAAGGSYTNARNHEQLMAEFEKTLKSAQEWLDWWLKEKNNLVMDKVSERGGIVTHTQNWKAQNEAESHKMQSVLLELQTQGKITSSQQNKIIDMRNNYYWDMGDKVDEMSNYLLSESYSDWSEKEKEINRIYDEK